MNLSRRHVAFRRWLRQHGIFAVTLVLLFLLPIPLGSNRIWAWASEAVITSGLLAGYLLLCGDGCWQRVNQRLAAIKPVLWLMTAWLVWNALPVLPLPTGWVSHLAPALANQAQASGVAPAALSLDRYASLLHLLQSLFYALFFILVFIQVTSPRRLRAVWWAVFAAALLQAVYGLWLVSMDSRGLVFGFYDVAAHNLAGSFVNRNHAVAFLSLGLLSGLALRLSWRRVRMRQDQATVDWRQRGAALLHAVRFLASPERVLDVALLLLVAALATTHSRAGVASALGAVVVFFWCVGRKPKARAQVSADTSSLLAAGTRRKGQGWVLLLTLILVGVFAGSELVHTGQRLAPGQDSLAGERWLAIQQGVRHVGEYFPWGVGGGAYQHFFVLHREAGQTHFFDHAHNDYLEFVIENGLGALILLALLWRVMRQAWRVCGTRAAVDSDLRLGASLAFATLIYFLLHGLLDFNARIPANALTALALAASFTGFWAARYRDLSPSLSNESANEQKEEGQSVTN